MVNKENSPPLTASIAKVSLGISELILISSIKSANNFLDEGIKRKYKVLTTFLNNDQRFIEVNKIDEILNKDDNVILIFGSEGHGIRKDIINKSTYNIAISSGINNKISRELVDSLNVGVSAGILINKVRSII